MAARASARLGRVRSRARQGIRRRRGRGERRTRAQPGRPLLRDRRWPRRRRGRRRDRIREPHRASQASRSETRHGESRSGWGARRGIARAAPRPVVRPLARRARHQQGHRSDQRKSGSGKPRVHPGTANPRRAGRLVSRRRTAARRQANRRSGRHRPARPAQAGGHHHRTRPVEPDGPREEETMAIALSSLLAIAVTVTAEPSSLTLGKDTGGKIAIRVTGAFGRAVSGASVTLTTNVGSVSDVEPAGDGGFSARYTPPKSRAPAVALLAADAEAGGDHAIGWLALPLLATDPGIRKRALPRPPIEATWMSRATGAASWPSRGSRRAVPPAKRRSRWKRKANAPSCARRSFRRRSRRAARGRGASVGLPSPC